MIFYNPASGKVWLEVGDCLVEMTGAITINTCKEKEEKGLAQAIHQHDTRLDELVSYTNDRRKLARKLANS